MGSLRIVMVIMFLLTAAIEGNTQQISRTGLVGTTGGGPFESACPWGSVLTGLRARAGSWTDAVAPICSRWVARTRTLGELPALPFQGGTGGEEVFQRCNGPSGVVVGFEAWHGDNHDVSVSHLSIHCGEYERPYLKPGFLGGSKVAIGNSQTGDGETRECGKFGENQVAAGIYGRSGAYLDAIGLACVATPAFIPKPKPGDCKEGFVRRLAGPRDQVCVSERSRDQVARENAQAASHVQPNGAYGSKTCVQGFVWRNAYDGDAVCVIPVRRDEVNQENVTQLGRIY